MGRGNTISTGNVGGKRLNNSYNQSSINTQKSFPTSPFDYGIVSKFNTEDKSIYFTPLYNNLTLTKPGTALPLFKNGMTSPKENEIVPLLRAPAGSSIISNAAGREVQSIYYLDPLIIDGNINANVVPLTVNQAALEARVQSGIDHELAKTAVRRTGNTYKDDVKLVITKLKTVFSSNEVIAGILGNIHEESGFDPNDLFYDTNESDSYGLIQWNTNSNSASDMASIGYVRSVGCSACTGTVTGQMDFLLRYPDFQNFKKFVVNLPSESPEQYAFDFARIVEGCNGCTEAGRLHFNRLVPYTTQPLYFKKIVNYKDRNGNIRPLELNQVKRSYSARRFFESLTSGELA
jgi:hypothetical protein